MVQNKKFHCLGPVTGSSKKFHENGFVNKSTSSNVENLESVVSLFGKEFSFQTALSEHTEILFDSCRKSFLFLHGQLTGRGLRVVTDNLNERLRHDVTQFLNYILHYLQSSSKNTEINSENLNKLEIQLGSLRLLFHKLSLARLPDHALAYYSSTLGQDCSSPALHLVHCHLDFRWLFVNIIEALNKAKENQNGISQFTQAAMSTSFCVEEEILLLMNELTWLAIVRYEKADKTELASFPAFSCVCVKELWFLLMHYPYTSQDFWVYFHQTLRVVLENTEPPTEVVQNSLKIEPADYLPCSNRNEFALWFLADLSRLLEYSPQGDYVGANTAAGEKFEVVDDVLRSLLSDGDGPSEAGMRNLIPLVSKIQAACGHMRGGPVMSLWEYYFKKINSTFYIPGSKLNSNIVMSKSGVALLEDVKSRLDGAVRDKRENSFLMFLRELGDHLQAVHRSGASSSRLCSRVFLKFSPSRPDKLKELLEQGVFHLASLYLTLALGSATPSIIHRLVELLAAIPRVEGMKDAKHEMIWKSYAACLIALEEMRADMTESVDVIMKHIDWCINHPAMPPLAHFIDGLKVIFQRDVTAARGLHQLIRPWITNYLKMCRKTEIVRFLSIFVPLVQKLRLCGGSLEAQSLRTKIEQFLIPNLTEVETVTTAELAALCALCCSRYKGEIFRHWSDRDDCSLSGTFLAKIVEEGGPNVMTQFPQLPSAVQQAWTRCCFSWGVTPETNCLSRCIGELPQMSSVKIDWSGPHPFKSFVEYFGIEYTMCQTLIDKSALRTLFLSFFPKFDKWLENQCKTLEQLEGDAADRFYEYSSEMFARCPHLIYSKSDPHCLLKIIMDNLFLPRQMYKVEYKPPSRVFGAMTRHLAGFLDGLFILDPERDPYISRLVRDVVSHYVPRLRDVSPSSHPLLPLLSNSERSGQLLSLLTGFLQVKAGSVSPHAPSILKLFRETVTSHSSACETIFNSTAEIVVELLIQLDELHPVKNTALDYLSSALATPSNRSQMLSVLSEACKKHMRLNSAGWYDAVRRIAPLCRVELAPLLPLATEVVVELEKRRGVENDSTLRRLLQNLELAVG